MSYRSDGRGRRCGLSIVLIAVVALSIAAVARAAPDYVVRVVGAQFAEAPPQNDKDLAVFNLQHGGGELVLLVSGNGQRGIIDLEDDASEKALEATLRRGERQLGKTSIDVWPFVKTTDDGQHLRVQLKIDGALSSDAESIHLAGKLVIVTAASQQTATVKDIAVKAGKRFKLGPAQVEISEVGKPQWGGDQYAAQVKLKSDQMIERIARLEFFDAKGQPVEAAEGGTMSMGLGGKRTVEISYRLKRKPKRLTLKATYWEGVEQVDVPVDLVVRKPY